MDTGIFESGNVRKLYFRLALPVVFSMVITLIYNLADTYFVAQTRNTDIVAGVALGMPIFTFLMALGNIFGQGGASLLSRLLGEKNEEGVRRVSSFCFYAALGTGILCTLLMLLAEKPMLSLLGASADTFSHAASYYRWLAYGAPFIVVSFIHSNLLRSEGLSKESMIGTVLGAVVNIILDPLCISLLQLGARGAAIATVIGYLASDLYFLYIVRKKSRILSLNPSQAALPAAEIGQIFGIGIPAAVVNIMQSVANNWKNWIQSFRPICDGPGILRLMPVLLRGLYLNTLSRAAVLMHSLQSLKEPSSGGSVLSAGKLIFF